MAINANELRIGNWITLRGDYFQVDGGDIYDLSRGKEVEDRVANPEDWKPILLTSELLEECGCLMLEKNEFVLGRYSIRKEKVLDNPKWEVYLLGNDATFHWIINISYLHQLQNLYFSLTGMELTIDLK